MWSIINIFYTATCFQKPGYCQKRTVSENPVNALNYPNCEKCSVIKNQKSNLKPFRSHHCRVCKQCVTKFDHHCLVIMNCVGLKNHSIYVLMLFIAFFCLFVCFLEELFYFYFFIFEGLKQLDWSPFIKKMVVLWFVGFNTAGGYAGTITLFSVHARYLALNRTTIEDKNNMLETARLLDFGFFPNLKLHFGNYWLQWLPSTKKFKYEGFIFSVQGSDFEFSDLTLEAEFHENKVIILDDSSFDYF